MDHQEAQKRLGSLLEHLCDTFNVPYPDEFALCGRLTTTAGLFKAGKERFLKGRITISKKYLDLNGYTAAAETLRHEFAHHYLFHKYSHISNFRERFRKSGHTEEFKAFCVQVGGKMNTQMCGEEYARHACTNYVKSEYKWKYICKCGEFLTKTKRAYSLKELKKYQCRVCHTTMTQEMKEAIT